MFSNEDEITIPIDSAKSNQMNNNNCKTVINITKPNILLAIGIAAAIFIVVVIALVVVFVIINQKEDEKKNDNIEADTKIQQIHIENIKILSIVHIQY